MNYLAIYNKGIKRTREEICEYFNDIAHLTGISYSRYPHIFDFFSTRMPSDSIKIKEIEKGIISFCISMQNVEFQIESEFPTKRDLKVAFRGASRAIGNGRYLDIKEKFLEVTDDKSLKKFLNNIYSPSILDSELWKKLIAIFEKTTMYKNICDDYKSLNKNYKKFAKSNSHEVEIFTLKFLNTGKIKMIYDEAGEEKEEMCDDFESLIDFISCTDWKYTLEKCIENECELFGNRSR